VVLLYCAGTQSIHQLANLHQHPSIQQLATNKMPATHCQLAGTATCIYVLKYQGTVASIHFFHTEQVGATAALIESAGSAVMHGAWHVLD
jgi:hypothetical protein